ncbi:hypothetical protein [Acinetobacter beijerinckii]|uniref:hypothetical protein n=1 Tax=Acinetobacter beijerinckii TaxID=262668 RepID=UPI003016DA84
MIRVKKYLLGTIFIFINSSVMAISCENLVKYRDTGLFLDYEKTIKKNTAAIDSLRLIQQIKKENDILLGKQPTINLVYQAVLTLKTTSDSIAAILKIVPSYSQSIKAAESAGKLSAKLINYSDNFNKMSDVISNGVFDTAIQEVLASQSEIFQIMQDIEQLYKNINEQKNEYEDGKNILKLLEKNTNALELQIKELNQKIISSNTKLDIINKLKNDIDAKCKG